MIGKILFIRRDNIGDLVCTTPAMSAARKAYPNAKIGILVNTYNAAAIAGNPDIDEVYVYEKAKHSPEKSKLTVWMSNANVLRRIRREKYDVAIGCGSFSPRLACYTHMTRARIRIGYTKKGVDASRWYTVPLLEPDGNLHEVERTMNLLSPLGVTGEAPKMRVFPSQHEMLYFKSLADAAGGIGKPCLAMHISSRRPENRWPLDHFISLGGKWAERYGTRIMLLWSPGSEKNVYHPGDDEKAGAIVNALGQDVLACRTSHLSELIAVLSMADIVVCGDGGAMHMAAGLGKPIVTMWGSTNQDRWRPFGINHIILQEKSRRAEDISVVAVFAALDRLLYNRSCL